MSYNTKRLKKHYVSKLYVFNELKGGFPPFSYYCIDI